LVPIQSLLIENERVTVVHQQVVPVGFATTSCNPAPEKSLPDVSREKTLAVLALFGGLPGGTWQQKLCGECTVGLKAARCGSVSDGVTVAAASSWR
jgi:hypothetical protein